MLDTRSETHTKTKPHTTKTARSSDRCPASERREAARRSAEKWISKRRKTRSGTTPSKGARFVGHTGVV